MLTSVRWEVCFEARWAEDLAAAVVAVDMAAYSDLSSLAELEPYAGSRMGPTGISQARKAVSLAEENSWSPREPVMRLLWEEWNPRALLLCSPPLFDRSGRHLAPPDLLDAVAGVAGEREGAVHLAGDQRARDVRSRDVGLEVVTMVASDQGDRRAFPERLAAAHRRAGRVPGERRWTTAVAVVDRHVHGGVSACPRPRSGPGCCVTGGYLPPRLRQHCSGSVLVW